MKKITTVLITGLAVLLLNACGDSDNPTTQDIAIDKISTYASDGGTAPTLQDYLDAGVTGITDLDEINSVVSGLTKEDVDTQEEIQALAEELGVETTANIPPIASVETTATTVTEGETVNFSSGNSTDTDGNIISYIWTESGEELAIVPSFSKSDFSIGTHTIILTVTDNDGATHTDTVSITVNPQTCLEAAGYGTIPINETTWLDRNLGASEVAADINDSAAFGELYQWGRSTDGHQELGSDANDTLATTLDGDNVNTPWYGKFITNSSLYPYDWVTGVDVDGTERALSWSTAYNETSNPNQVCPCGYIVPTRQDFIDLNLADPSVVDAFKLANADWRYFVDGIIQQENRTKFWTSTNGIYGPNSVNVLIWSNSTFSFDFSGGGSAGGYSVRCIKAEDSTPYIAPTPPPGGGGPIE